jgi:glutamate dehydrogenase/leucine dehydrogenase
VVLGHARTPVHQWPPVSLTSRRRRNTKIVVIGGSGLIGTKVVKTLTEQGHEALAASPSTGVGATTGRGLAEVSA